MPARFVLHHNPQSRSQRIRWLLEEAGVGFELAHVDFEAGAHKSPEFLKLNPDGKLPTLIDRGPDGTWSTVVTESAAIVIYVADLAEGAPLAPPPGDPRRAAYLTWIAYVGAAVEPALTDFVFPRAGTPPASALGWPPYEAVLARVAAALQTSPYLVGEDFTAADVMMGAMLMWANGWGKLPEPERFASYFERLSARPAALRAKG
jgi:glutathione S-transferase